MQYRLDKHGNKLSILGFGCLRFPQKRGKIDMEQTEQQIMAAIEGGVNYLDTAYVYGGSEAAVGEILEKNNARDRVNIATKLPHYLIKSREALDKLFCEELRRLRTDHVEYYLMHMLTDPATWDRLKGLGIEQWLREKKESGAIGQVGFSYHGNSETFCKLLDVYDWDFCQIQYNYLDEHTQAGRRGLQYAHSKGLPVIIMEPLRGGRLVNNLPEKAKKLFQGTGRSAAEWAFRWLWDQKEVTVVLSGMNSMEMVAENMKVADQVQIGEMDERQQALLQKAVKEILSTVKVGCTGCAYCMPCPKGVDIPGTFASYNRYYSDSKFAAMKEYFMCTTLRQKSAAASQCIGCGKCEQHCPQTLPIREKLQEAKKTLENPVYRIARSVAAKIMKY